MGIRMLSCCCLGAHWLLILPGGSQAHRVLEVLCSIQDGGVFSSRLSLLHHLEVQRALFYVSLLGYQTCLHDGVGVKAWLYLPMTWSHQGTIHSLAGSISMGWSNCINSSCRSWRLLTFVQGGIPRILYLVSASRMVA